MYSRLEFYVQKLRQCSCEFEKNVPFYLRCRAALLATPSRFPQVEAAIEASPEPSRRSVAISFQVCQPFQRYFLKSSAIGKLTTQKQTNFALNISETIINLHRPYYAKALYDVDRVESIYKPSFYTVIERCGAGTCSDHRSIQLF